MALVRADYCSHATDLDGVFLGCVMTYNAYYEGSSSIFTVKVEAADVPLAPTDEQIYTVSDVTAITLYNNWLNTIQHPLVIGSNHTGLAGTVVA